MSMRFTITATRLPRWAGTTEALADYDKVLALRPRHVPALNRRGDALAALERRDEALAAYDAALAIESVLTPNCSIIAAVTLLDLGRRRRSIGKRRARAGRFRPDYADALYNRGNALLALGPLR